MTVQTRATLKAYFDNGDVMTAQSFVDLMDSFVHLSDTTAQTLNSDLIFPNLTVTDVCANNAAITGTLRASAAKFTGAVRQGVSAAASAADSRGYVLVVQESTVAASATSQVAFLPSTSNIQRLAVKVLAASSGAGGGTTIRVGDAADGQRFGSITVSAVGLFEITGASVAALTGVSGRIEMVAPTATAGANFIGIVQYYQRA